MKKKDFIKKVESLGCSVEIDLEDGRNKTVRIIAPKGKNLGGSHELITTWYSGKAEDLYKEAFDYFISSPDIWKCEAGTCGSWIEEGGEHCEYWEESSDE